MVHNDIRRPWCSKLSRLCVCVWRGGSGQSVRCGKRKTISKTLIYNDSPARIEMALADGPPEESLAAVTGRRAVVFSSRPVAADGACLVLIGHGRRVYLRRVDGLQIGLLAVHRHAVEVRFCYKSVFLKLLETIFFKYYHVSGCYELGPPLTSLYFKNK